MDLDVDASRAVIGSSPDDGSPRVIPDSEEELGGTAEMTEREKEHLAAAEDLMRLGFGEPMARVKSEEDRTREQQSEDEEVVDIMGMDEDADGEQEVKKSVKVRSCSPALSLSFSS